MQFQPDARSTKLDLLFSLFTTKIYQQDSPQPSTCCGAVMPTPAQFPAWKQLSLQCAMSTGGLELSNRTARNSVIGRDMGIAANVTKQEPLYRRQEVRRRCTFIY